LQGTGRRTPRSSQRKDRAGGRRCGPSKGRVPKAGHGQEEGTAGITLGHPTFSPSAAVGPVEMGQEAAGTGWGWRWHGGDGGDMEGSTQEAVGCRARPFIARCRGDRRGRRPSEQGAGALALHLGGGPGDAQLLLAVGRVAHGVEDLPAHATVQAAAAVGEGVEGELAVVHPQAAVPCNAQHRSLVGGWVWPSPTLHLGQRAQN